MEGGHQKPGEKKLPAWALVSQNGLAVLAGTRSPELLRLPSALSRRRPFLLGSRPWAHSGANHLSGLSEPRLLWLGHMLPREAADARTGPSGDASVQKGRPDTLYSEIRPCKAGTGGASPGDKPILPPWCFLAINFDQRKHYLSHLSKPTLQLQD